MTTIKELIIALLGKKTKQFNNASLFQIVLQNLQYAFTETVVDLEKKNKTKNQKPIIFIYSRKN